METDIYIKVWALLPWMRSSATRPCCFKSRGEERIACSLDEHGIEYQYEHPLAVLDRGKVRLWYPDFRLPDYQVWIEYCGRMSDPRYREGMERKKKVYAENGIEALLYGLGDVFGPDWPKPLLASVEALLHGRYVALRQKRASLLRSKAQRDTEWS